MVRYSHQKFPRKDKVVLIDMLSGLEKDKVIS